MEYYLAIIKEWNLTISDSMNWPRGYYAMWNKSVKERQIPYDFTYMWNLKNNINEKTRKRQTHRYREQTDGCERGGRLEVCVKKVKGLRSTDW